MAHQELIKIIYFIIFIVCYAFLFRWLIKMHTRIVEKKDKETEPIYHACLDKVENISTLAEAGAAHNYILEVAFKPVGNKFRYKLSPRYDGKFKQLLDEAWGKQSLLERHSLVTKNKVIELCRKAYEKGQEDFETSNTSNIENWLKENV